MRGRRGRVVTDASREQTSRSGARRGSRAPRNRRPPARYRAPGAVVDDGEEFDLNDHSDVDEEPNAGTVDGLATSRSAPDPTVTDPFAIDGVTSNPTLTDPLGTNAPSTSNKAFDVEFFFRKDKNEVEDTVCKPCEKVIADLRAKGETYSPWQYEYSPKTSNTSLRHHIEVRHALLYLEQAERHGWVVWVRFARTALASGYTFKTLKHVITQPGVKLDALPPPPTDSSDHLPAGVLPQQRPLLGANLPPFTIDGLKHYIIRYFVANDLAINKIENPHFRELILYCAPRDTKDSDIPHRTKMRELILHAFKTSFFSLRAELLQAMGEISFTADIWSSDSLNPYLAVTAHWIGKDQETGEGTCKLRFRSALIAFHYIPGKHTGVAIANALLHIIDRARIPLKKIGHFTMDNASNNDAAMTELSKILRDEREFVFDATERRIRCLPHIFNICVQLTLDKYVHADFSQCPESWTNSAGTVIDRDDYVESVRADPVGRGRNVVRSIRASGQRRTNFRLTVTSGNDQEWFVNEAGELCKLPVVQLLRDVKTRWDSTYYMINRLRALHQAVDHFLDIPRNIDISDQKLAILEWEVLQDMEVVLEVPSHAQLTMCGQSLPLLGGAIPSFEMFLARWRSLSLSPSNPQLAPFITDGLDRADHYYHRLGRTNAYLFAMFVDPCLRFSWVEDNWDTEAIAAAKANIIRKMEEYRVRYPLENVTPSQLPQLAQPRTFMTLGSKYGLPNMTFRAEERGTQSVDHEFNLYANGGIAHSRTDPLVFWELERERFPTIFRMAMDYLPAQPSSVPCERAFSSSSLTDTKQRNRINPVLMEALQLLKSSLKGEKPSLKTWLTSQKEMLRNEEGSHVLATALPDSDGDADGIDEILKVIAAEDDETLSDAVDIF